MPRTNKSTISPGRDATYILVSGDEIHMDGGAFRLVASINDEGNVLLDIHNESLTLAIDVSYIDEDGD